VQQAVDLGVTLFDSAESYKSGRSEEILGLVLGNREDMCVATKMGGPKRDMSAARVVEAAEASLKRLRRDRIDIYQIHSPNREEMERFDWADGLARLKDQGKIRFRAVAVNNAADALCLIEQGLVEALQITYNLLNTEAEEGLFEVAKREGVGLLCRLPLAQGILTGKFRPGEVVPEGHRAHRAYHRMAERIQKADDLRSVGDAYEGGLTRMALHFSLTPRAISAIIPGARTSRQLAENVAASHVDGLPDAVRQEIDRVRAGWDV
jgi:aryl-alcohol dehydrogenase-like predicted oxidoreductase